jgi:predicted dehydrogenase
MPYKKKSLVVGYGSIGRRHARLLQSLGCQVSIVSRQAVGNYPFYTTLKAVADIDQYDYAVICNETVDHYGILRMLTDTPFNGAVLIEKPVFEKVREIESSELNIFVAYQLRFHPLIERVKSELGNRQVYSMHVYCGQYLPDWRPGRDYRKTYSASRERGGGVLNDLSHELDIVCWLTGKWQRVCAMGGTVSDLDIDSDDVFAMLMETQNCPIVTLQVNYLDRDVKRQIIINAKGLSIEIDLIRNTIKKQGDQMSMAVEKDEPYKRQLMSLLNGGTDIACTLEEGLDIVALIESARKSEEEKKWIKRS